MSTWRTFPLRILKATWGIAIDFQARAMITPDEPHGLLAVSKRVLLDVRRVSLPAVEIRQLQTGLLSMAPGIEASIEDGYVVIEVGDVAYAPTDYQPEGLAAAIVGWVAEEFGLEPELTEVHFDKAENRYVFSR